MIRPMFWVAFFASALASSAIAAPVAAGGSISANYSGTGVVGSESYGLPPLNAYRQHRAVEALVQEGRQMERADGGTLTAQHHAYLQAKLKAILAGNY